MLSIPRHALSHLILANDAEIARLERFALGFGDGDWPEGLDANDLRLHEMVRGELIAANLTVDEIIQFNNWKGTWFLTRLIPSYIEMRKERLSNEDASAIMDVYRQTLPRHDL